MADKKDFRPSCPFPISDYPRVLIAHGGGGRLTHDLIRKLFLPAFGGPEGSDEHDGARMEIPGGKAAFTTDSYVVQPLFFPGGDIGTLAVNGTINDLAMCGARPVALSAGFIIEEGLPMETLCRVADSMKRTATAAGVRIVTGDTKVVDKGRGDGLFINTAGLGVIEHEFMIAPRSVQPGDRVLVSGDVGRHGIAVMASREGLKFETTVESDCAPLWTPVERLLRAGIQVRCLRDLTRGGLAAALVEIAETSGLDIAIQEEEVPVLEQVRGACELLGLDPLAVANEGRFIAFVPEEQSIRARELMGPEAREIGEVPGGRKGRVTVVSRLGTARILDMPSGEQLPRIC